MTLRVNGERLWRSIEEINRFGATAAGGVCRPEFSRENQQARDLFVRWCREAGCEVRVDRIGNLFARRAGRTPSAPAVVAGSHLDTQTSGGRFDGVFGVMAGLEVVRTLNDAGIVTEAPLEIAVWTNEEGERFRPMLGSAVWTGALPLEEALAMREQDGSTVQDGLARMGYLGTAPIERSTAACYFEAHIEQGPVLFERGATIGVVRCSQAQLWYDLRVRGQEAHAGPTPMDGRRDAMVAAARMILEFDRIGREFPDGRSTCGHLNVYPNSRNTVPGGVHFTGDLRNPAPEVLREMDRDMRRNCAEIARAAGVDLDIRVHTTIDFIPFDATLTEWVRAAARELGYSAHEMYTGAGHDACNIARVLPTTMVFVPCKDGISHNPAEDARPEHLAAGAEVLANVMLRAARDGA